MNLVSKTITTNQRERSVEAGCNWVHCTSADKIVSAIGKVDVRIVLVRVLIQRCTMLFVTDYNTQAIQQHMDFLPHIFASPTLQLNPSGPHHLDIN